MKTHRLVLTRTCALNSLRTRGGNPGRQSRHRLITTAACAAILLLHSGCATPWQTTALTAGVATATGAYSPNNEIEQIYYLGVFDPYEQVPPSVYRVRVHGQASFISRTKFASGWVRADLIDSLGTEVKWDRDKGGISISKTGDNPLSSITPERRMMLFGPEGFREAPKDHRLVLVMGASPQEYFEAVDSALGSVSQAQAELRNSSLNSLLFEALIQVKSEKDSLAQLARDVDTDLPEAKGAE